MTGRTQNIRIRQQRGRIGRGVGGRGRQAGQEGERQWGGGGSPSRPDNEDLRDTETTKTEDLDQQHDKDDGGRRPDVVVFPVVGGGCHRPPP